MRLGSHRAAADSGISSDRNRTGNLVVLCDHRGAYGGFRRHFGQQDGLLCQAYVRRQKNLWQVAMVIGIVVGAFASMEISEPAARQSRHIWNELLVSAVCLSRAPIAFRAVLSWSWELASPTAAPLAMVFRVWRGWRCELQDHDKTARKCHRREQLTNCGNQQLCSRLASIWRRAPDNLASLEQSCWFPQFV